MKTYLINLDRSTERLARERELFDRCGVPFERVPGVDGRKLSAEEIRRACNRFRFFLSTTRRVIVGEIGVALAHLECWRRLLASGEDRAAIFEDDADFEREDVRRALAAVEADDVGDRPTCWLFQTGLPRPKDLADDAVWYRTVDAPRNFGYVWTNTGYACNAAAAKILIRLNSPLRDVCDNWTVFARCGIEVKAYNHAFCRQFAYNVRSTVEHKPQSRWRFRLYWFRYLLAMRVNVLLMKLGI